MIPSARRSIKINSRAARDRCGQLRFMNNREHPAGVASTDAFP
jgi:hypothetical protein